MMSAGQSASLEQNGRSPSAGASAPGSVRRRVAAARHSRASTVRPRSSLTRPRSQPARPHRAIELVEAQHRGLALLRARQPGCSSAAARPPRTTGAASSLRRDRLADLDCRLLAGPGLLRRQAQRIDDVAEDLGVVDEAREAKRSEPGPIALTRPSSAVCVP